jgi:hypothetical protein
MPENNKKDIALRKRQQIEKAGKTMFLWVALASAIVGVAGVLSVTLIRQMMFNQEVISEMSTTLSNLRDNNKVATELKDNVRVMNTNQALVDTPRLAGAEPISVVLDALPAQANSAALGASLEQKLLVVDGVSLESLIVEQVAEDETTGESSNEIGFSFSVETNRESAGKLREVLTDLQRSIRVIDIVNVTIEQQGENITMTVEARAFYLPEKQVELNEKKVP